MKSKLAREISLSNMIVHMEIWNVVDNTYDMSMKFEILSTDNIMDEEISTLVWLCIYSYQS